MINNLHVLDGMKVWELILLSLQMIKTENLKNFMGVEELMMDIQHTDLC
jgi:hypothetical protein